MFSALIPPRRILGNYFVASLAIVLRDDLGPDDSLVAATWRLLDAIIDDEPCPTWVIPLVQQMIEKRLRARPSAVRPMGRLLPTVKVWQDNARR